MEEEIDMLFDNATSIEEEYHHERPLIHSIYRYIGIFIAIIGTFFNVVIIYIILRNKRMRTRTNIILLNWCTSDILYLISKLYLFCFLIMDQFKNSEYVACTIFGLEGVFSLVSIIFMIILITPNLIKRTRIQIAVILATTYTIAAIIYLADTIACSHLTFEVLAMIYVVTFAYLFISVVIEDFNRCRKKSAIPTSENTLTRLNIAKIVVYNFIISIIFRVLIEFVIPLYIRDHFIMLNFTRTLTAFYIWLYLYRTNKQFKICMLSFSKFDFTSSDVDVTILYEEASDVEQDENVKVNINVRM